MSIQRKQLQNQECLAGAGPVRRPVLIPRSPMSKPVSPAPQTFEPTFVAGLKTIF